MLELQYGCMKACSFQLNLLRSTRVLKTIFVDLWNISIILSILEIVVSSFSNFLNEKVSFCLKGASQDMYLNNS